MRPARLRKKKTRLGLGSKCVAAAFKSFLCSLSWLCNKNHGIRAKTPFLVRDPGRLIARSHNRDVISRLTFIFSPSHTQSKFPHFNNHSSLFLRSGCGSSRLGFPNLCD